MSSEVTIVSGYIFTAKKNKRLRQKSRVGNRSQKYPCTTICSAQQKPCIDSSKTASKASKLALIAIDDRTAGAMLARRRRKLASKPEAFELQYTRDKLQRQNDYYTYTCNLPRYPSYVNENPVHLASRRSKNIDLQQLARRNCKLASKHMRLCGKLLWQRVASVYVVNKALASGRATMPTASCFEYRASQNWQYILFLLKYKGSYIVNMHCNQCASLQAGGDTVTGGESQGGEPASKLDTTAGGGMAMLGDIKGGRNSRQPSLKVGKGKVTVMLHSTRQEHTSVWTAQTLWLSIMRLARDAIKAWATKIQRLYNGAK
jgi:hypothetical protein